MGVLIRFGRNMDELLDQKSAARILRLSVRTLERHRLAGTGPKFCRLGRVIRYRESDLRDWLEASIRTSTSDAAPSKRTEAA
jgi:predicted DNA-binding transcriptional regulator AlpA